MSSRADTILRIARTSGAQTLSSEVGLLPLLWSMRASARWRAGVPPYGHCRGWIIGAAIDKTFAPAQKNLSQSRWQLALVTEASRPTGKCPFPGPPRVVLLRRHSALRK